LRLSDIESKLSPVIETYLKEVYPYLRGKPYPAIICFDDPQFKAALKVRDTKTSVKAAYNIPTNTLYFRNKPIEAAIAHESEHWAQTYRIGPDSFIEQMQVEKVYREYEDAADQASQKNAHLLTGKY
jgi:hypothetical protein